MNIACVQFESASTASIEENTRINLEKAEGFIRTAREAGAELIVFPEIFNTGYFPDLLAGTDEKSIRRAFSHTADTLANSARLHGLTIAAGMAEPADSGDRILYNSVLVLSPGGDRTAYRKICLFPRSREPEIFTPGDTPIVFRVGNFTVGILICYELRFPELSRLFIDRSCDLLIVPAAFPASRGRHWRTLLQARAIENQMYVAAADHAGAFGTLEFAGSSMIVDPAGTVLASAGEKGEQLLIAGLSETLLRDTRDFIPCYRDRERLRQLLGS